MNEPSPFEQWVRQDAAKNAELRRLVKWARSAWFLVKMVGIACLFAAYAWPIIKRVVAEHAKYLSTSNQVEESVETTIEGVRRGLYDSPIDGKQEPDVAESVPKEAVATTSTKSQTPSPPPKTETASVKAAMDDGSNRVVSVIDGQHRSSTAKTDTTGPEIAQTFLEQMRDATATRQNSLATRETQLAQQDRILFWAFIIAATITLVIAIAGIVLVFLQQLTIGLLSESVAIFSGGATAILKSLSRSIKEQMKVVARSRQEYLDILQAIQATLLIPDFGLRAGRIVTLADTLVARTARSRGV